MTNYLIYFEKIRLKRHNAFLLALQTSSLFYSPASQELISSEDE